jgi:hypothetical protein
MNDGSGGHDWTHGVEALLQLSMNAADYDYADAGYGDANIQPSNQLHVQMDYSNDASYLNAGGFASLHPAPAMSMQLQYAPGELLRSAPSSAVLGRKAWADGAI